MTNKLYLLTLVCILTATTDKSFAQNYLSLFGDNSTTWDIVLHGYCDAVCSQTITVTGDTSINADTYKVISGLPGFVREDTVQGKAWFYDTYYNTEFLVMDLGLNLGDNFIIYDLFNVANPMTVDSVYYADNKKHVRLNAWTTMCSLNEKITFIEGSGTTASFGYQRDLNGSVSSSMLCHHKDGVRVSGNVLFNDSCYECSVGINENTPTSIKVTLFPNPTHDLLTIENKDFISTEFKLTIYNLVGNKTYSQTLTDPLTTVKVSNLSSGIYYAVVTDNTRTRHLKFIKE
jgi:hypothetical protein